MIKNFKCGLCKPENRVIMSRSQLREHLRKEHIKKIELTNFENSRGKLQTQPWWIEEK